MNNQIGFARWCILPHEESCSWVLALCFRQELFLYINNTGVQWPRSRGIWTDIYLYNQTNHWFINGFEHVIELVIFV